MFNLQTAVAAILVFVECPNSIASEVLVVLRPFQNVKSIRQAVFKLSRSQEISCIGYTVNLQTAVAAILVFIGPKSIASEVLVVLRPYQNVKSIRQAVFKISRSQAISCIGYNVNLQIVVAPILDFVEYPKSIASEVLVVSRPNQNVKSIRQAVFKISCSQAISCIWFNVNLQTAVAAILVFVECPKSIATEVLVVLRPYQNVKSIRQAVFKISRSQAISCIWYNVNLQIVVAAILVFVEYPKSIASEVLVVSRPNQNVKSIRQAVFKISCSQAISCIWFNVNLQTAVAAILVFVEYPRSIASEVLVVLRPYQNVKTIRKAVFKISRSQAIVDGRTDGQTDGRTDRRTGPFHNTSRLLTGV